VRLWHLLRVRKPRRLATAETTFRTSCVRCCVLEKGLGFNHKIMINVLGVATWYYGH